MPHFLRASGETLTARAHLVRALLERPSSMEELTEACGLHHQTVRNFLLALQTVGLLEMQMNEDNRKTVYQLRATLWE